MRTRHWMLAPVWMEASTAISYRKKWKGKKETGTPPSTLLRSGQEPATSYQRTPGKMCGHNLTGYISPVMLQMFISLGRFQEHLREI